MAKKLKVSANYLEYIPQFTEGLQMETSEEGLLVVLVENKGFFNRIAQKFFKQPKVSKAHLDELGTFVFQQIDGTHTVQQIAEAEKEQFGDKVEPVYNRLVTYMETLKKCGFIHFINEEEMKKQAKQRKKK